MSVANYTPAVLTAAKTIRKLVNDLTMAELVALREALNDGTTPPELIGVREPRRPSPPTLDVTAHYETDESS